MPYQLQTLAPGSYDLLLDGTVIGSVVRDVTASGNLKGWRAELLEFGAGVARPKPFTAAEHEFTSLAEVCDWLGNPVVLDERNND